MRKFCRDLRSQIEFDNVSFGYDGPLILKAINLRCRRGPLLR